ncbi:hypothetical protein Bhyg_10545, partial [Pseudolycoriella hygida]
MHHHMMKPVYDNCYRHDQMFVRDSLDHKQLVNTLQLNQYVEQGQKELTVTTVVDLLNALVDHNLHDRLKLY